LFEHECEFALLLVANFHGISWCSNQRLKIQTVHTNCLTKDFCSVICQNEHFLSRLSCSMWPSSNHHVFSICFRVRKTPHLGLYWRYGSKLCDCWEARGKANMFVAFALVCTTSILGWQTLLTEYLVPLRRLQRLFLFLVMLR
jgi:hypothetical protein